MSYQSRMIAADERLNEELLALSTEVFNLTILRNTRDNLQDDEDDARQYAAEQIVRARHLVQRAITALKEGV